MAKNQTNTSSYESVLKQASKKQGSIFHLHKTYPAFIILVFFVASSFLIWRTVDQSVISGNQASFDKATTSVVTRFDANYKRHQDVLGSMRGLYDNMIQVVRDYFTLYAIVPTKTYSSIICMMSVNRVEKKNLPEFIHYVRSQGYYDYKLHPEANRNVYYPSEFIVPDTTNLNMKGFDFSSDQVFVDEIIYAQQTNSVRATPIMKIRGKDTNAVYILSPIFKRGLPHNTDKEKIDNFEGLVVLELNLTKMLQNAMGKGESSDTSVIFQCFYQNEDKQEVKVFESANAGLLADKNFKPYLTSERILNIQEEKLIIKFYTIPNFGGSFQKYLPLVSLIGSLVLSFVFFGFILSVITSRTRAEDLAERMTRSQRRIVDSSNDIIAVLGFDNIWKSMNPASLGIFGYEPREMIGSKLDMLYVGNEDRFEFEEVAKVNEEDHRNRFSIQMKTKSGNLIWMNWDISVSLAERLIYCIGRDITLEKIAEEQERLKSKQIELAKQFTSEASESKSYFMTKLSHQLRNSLTSIIGYHQLLANRLYDTDEEHDSYIDIVNESSEELFVFVSDMIEVTMQNTAEQFGDLHIITLDQFKEIIDTKAKNEIANLGKLNIEIYSTGTSSALLADQHLIENAMVLVFKGLSEFKDKLDIDININDNPFEGAVEIQILTSPNPDVTDLIDVYKQNTNNLIDALKFDKNDVLLSLGISSSMFRMMSGSMSVESFGRTEGNLVQITLPVNKQID